MCEFISIPLPGRLPTAAPAHTKLCLSVFLLFSDDDDVVCPLRAFRGPTSALYVKESACIFSSMRSRERQSRKFDIQAVFPVFCLLKNTVRCKRRDLRTTGYPRQTAGLRLTMQCTAHQLTWLWMSAGKPEQTRRDSNAARE